MDVKSLFNLRREIHFSNTLSLALSILRPALKPTEVYDSEVDTTTTTTYRYHTKCLESIRYETFLANRSLQSSKSRTARIDEEI